MLAEGKKSTEIAEDLHLSLPSIKWCRQLGKKNVCLVSIHTNAAGKGRQWMTARGWCCYTSRGQTAGDRLATCLYEAVSLFFHYNPQGIAFLESAPGRQAILDLQIQGIIRYINHQIA